MLTPGLRRHKEQFPRTGYLLQPWKWSLIILSVCLLCLTGAEFCGAEEDLYRLSADQISYSESEQACAQGNVRLYYQQVEIFADSLLWDPRTGQVTANGNVKVVSADRALAGDTLSYNLASDTGEMLPAKGQFRDLFLRAKRIEILPDRMIAHDARMTTCELERPHYQIFTRRATIYLARKEGRTTPQEVQIQSAGLEFHGRRLLSLPPFRISLTGEPGTGRSLPLPYPGYSGADGPFLGYRWGRAWPGDKFSLGLDSRFTRDRGTRAALYARYALTKNDLLQVAVSRKEDLRERFLGPREIDTGLAKVLIDRRPELALQSGPRRAAKGLRWEVNTSAGRYREEPTEVSSDRIATTGRLLLGPFPSGRSVQLSGAAAYRVSFYDDDDKSEIFYNRMTVSAVSSRDFNLALSLVGRHAAGSTPFLFDRVDLSRELAGEVGLPAGKHWRVKLLNRYDLQRHQNRDIGVDVTYRAHCLDYSLGWRKNRGFFQFGVGLALPATAKGVD